MDVGIDEGRGDQRSFEVDHRVDPVGVSGCSLIGADPRDVVVGNDKGRREGVSRAVDEAAAIQRGRT